MMPMCNDFVLRVKRVKCKKTIENLFLTKFKIFPFTIINNTIPNLKLTLPQSFNLKVLIVFPDLCIIPQHCVSKRLSPFQWSKNYQAIVHPRGRPSSYTALSLGPHSVQTAYSQ